ncbi:MAG: manganese catalase family protein [Ktedonobacterales bacterium]|nr:manganese catalase family protein [Ktedonobacterales bacterium]
MYVRNNRLQYPVRVEKPDPLFAKQVQELLGGKYGEFTVMAQYLQQGWGLRGAESNPKLTRIKDLLLDTAMEEMMHVEMLSTMIGLLLTGASPDQQAQAADASPAVAAVLGGMNPRHVIVAGLGAQYADSLGNPWNGAYVTASGNVAADMYTNAICEMQGRLQAARVRELTDDTGVRDTLTFMLARDLLHQEQWLAVVEELGGATTVLPIPAQLTADTLGKHEKVAYAVMSYSADPAATTTGEGRWASDPSIDGKGTFSYIAEPYAEGTSVDLPAAPAAIYGSLPGDPTGATIAPKGTQGKRAKDTSLIHKIGDAITGNEA